MISKELIYNLTSWITSFKISYFFIRLLLLIKNYLKNNSLFDTLS